MTRLSFSPVSCFLIFLLSVLIERPSTFVQAAIAVSEFPRTNADWAFLGRFCFDESGGVLWLNLQERPELLGKQTINLYADRESQWPAVYALEGEKASNISWCEWRESQSQWKRELYKLPHDAPLKVKVIGNQPRWWYIAISNCEGGQLGLTHYNVTFENQNAQNFNRHFAKDEQGMYEMTIVFLVLYTVLLFSLYYCKRIAKRKGLNYSIIKLIAKSIFFSAAALCFHLVHLFVFSRDGVGLPACYTTYYCLDSLAQLFILVLVMDLAKGKAISTNFINNRRQANCIILGMAVLYMIMYIWDSKVRDPAAVVYIYESAPGFLVISARLALMCWAVWTLRETHNLEQNPRKKKFYQVFCLFVVAWFLSLPVTVFIAHHIPAAFRRKIVNGLVNSITSVNYMVLFWFFRPTGSNRYLEVLKPGEDIPFPTNHMQVFPELQLTSLETL